jgi:hypothetical protein
VGKEATIRTGEVDLYVETFRERADPAGAAAGRTERGPVEAQREAA